MRVVGNWLYVNYTELKWRIENILLTLSQPLRHEVWGGDREEGGVVGLGGHRLGQVWLPCSRRTEEQDASPWGPFAWETKDTEEKFVFKVVLISVYDCLLGLNRMKRLETYSTCEKVRKFDGQDDCFLQSFLSSFQPSNIIPPHIGFLHYNSTYTHKKKSNDDTPTGMQLIDTAVWLWQNQRKL